VRFRQEAEWIHLIEVNFEKSSLAFEGSLAILGGSRPGKSGWREIEFILIR
jgi:hypothetical protein